MAAEQRMNGRKFHRNGTTRQSKSHFSPPKKKRKQYTPQQMLKMAATGLMSICKVVQRNNVSSTTLHSG